MIPLGIAIAALVLVAAPAHSQARTRLLRLPAPMSMAPDPPAQLGHHRNPVAAGALSFVLPFGTGSFYAGHARHGVTHLAVGVVSSTAMFLGTIGCLFDHLGGGDNEASCTAGNVGAAVFVMNWGWGVVSAVNDARAFNRRATTPPPR